MAVSVDVFVDQIATVAKKHCGKKKNLRDDILVAVTEELEVTIPSVYHAVLVALIQADVKPKTIDIVGNAIKQQCVAFTIQLLPETLSNILDVCSSDTIDHHKTTSRLATDIKVKSTDTPYFIVTEWTNSLKNYVSGIKNFDAHSYTKLCNHDLLTSLKCSDVLEDASEYETEDASEYETEDASEYETESVCSSDSDLWLVWEDKRTELENEIKAKNEHIEHLEEELKCLRKKAEQTDVQVQAFAILGMTITFLCISVPRFLTKEQLLG